MLQDRQVDFFRMFGFLPLPGFFTPDEVDVMEREYTLALTAVQPAYCSAIGLRGQMSWSNSRPDTPFLADALELDKLHGAAAQLLSPDVVGVMTNGNVFSGNQTEWHADTSTADFRSLKFVAYLDPVGADSGALRVMPGSHRSPWHEELIAIGPKQKLNTAGNPEAGDTDCNHFEVAEIPAQVCASVPGDVLAFDLRAWHASWNGFPNRRMCSFTYFDSPRNEVEDAALRSVVAQFGQESRFRELRRQRDWISAGFRPGQIPRRERQYSPEWLANEGHSPVRDRWIRQLSDWGMIPREKTPAS